LYGIQVARGVVELGNRVRPRATAEAVGVAPEVPSKKIVPGAAVEYVAQHVAEDLIVQLVASAGYPTRDNNLPAFLSLFGFFVVVRSVLFLSQHQILEIRPQHIAHGRTLHRVGALILRFVNHVARLVNNVNVVSGTASQHVGSGPAV
jgi:hypothetical protein